jgi:hypothetical protein
MNSKFKPIFPIWDYLEQSVTVYEYEWQLKKRMDIFKGSDFEKKILLNFKVIFSR